MILNAFTDSFYLYDALKTVVCLVAVQSLAAENEERIDEKKQNKKKTEVPIPSFLFLLIKCVCCRQSAGKPFP